ncbi:colicin immunity protein [Noviherbaspirillum massiliense]|uniref:colicin immunity protein n=1 Tax=Noviherbaspirillum massiliense TaxID=1465823 RepID=UPI0004744F43|nr:colicin immunity protein [Noviherbaspirillum massiliense]
MSVDRASLHDKPELFFEMEGSSWLKLTPAAARVVCTQAASYGLVIVRVEGGIWHSPGFEARIDCIWDGINSLCTIDEARQNNERAVRNIEHEQAAHGAFILTAVPIVGYEHAKVRHAI